MGARRTKQAHIVLQNKVAKADQKRIWKLFKMVNLQ
jgi:hypothetical protein